MGSSDAQKTQFPNGFQGKVLKDRVRERIARSVHHQLVQHSLVGVR